MTIIRYASCSKVGPHSGRQGDRNGARRSGRGGRGSRHRVDCGSPGEGRCGEAGERLLRHIPSPAEIPDEPRADRVHLARDFSPFSRRIHERSQIDFGVAKLGGLDPILGLDQRHRAAQVSSPVDGYGRKNSSVLSVEGHEVSFFHATPHHKLVPFGVEPGVLEVKLVLSGPEPGNLLVGLALAQHAPGSGRTLPKSVAPVLDADVSSEDRVVVVGHVPRSVDSFNGSPTVLVNHDAVVDLYSGTGE
jgi:hypothetical protein